MYIDLKNWYQLNLKNTTMYDSDNSNTSTQMYIVYKQLLYIYMHIIVHIITYNIM